MLRYMLYMYCKLLTFSKYSILGQNVAFTISSTLPNVMGLYIGKCTVLKIRFQKSDLHKLVDNYISYKYCNLQV